MPFNFPVTQTHFCLSHNINCLEMLHLIDGEWKKLLNAVDECSFTVCGHECCQSKKGGTKNARRHSRHTTREKFCSSGDIYKSSSAEAAREDRFWSVLCIYWHFLSARRLHWMDSICIYFSTRGRLENSLWSCCFENEYLPGGELIWHSARVDKLN